MFEKVSVPVLGIIENMSLHVCSNCGHVDHIFGAGGGARLAAEFGVTLLGELPLDTAIREQADGGRPTVVAEPDGAPAATSRPPGTRRRRWRAARVIAVRCSRRSSWKTPDEH